MNDLKKLLKNAGLTEGAIDYVGRKMSVKTTNGKPSANQAPHWAKYLGQAGSGSWFWLQHSGPSTLPAENNYYPESGKIEFSGYVSDPAGWENSLEQVR